MASNINYKFGASKYWNRLKFEGTHLSVQDFVDKIFELYRFDPYHTSLKLRNLYSKREYTDLNEMLLKNTGVEVMRMPGHGNRALQKWARLPYPSRNPYKATNFC